MILAKTHKIKQPDFVEERDTRYLLIWREQPHWMVVDEEAYNLIKLIDGSRTLKDIIKQLYSTELQDKKFQEINSFIFNIKKKGLLIAHNKANLESSIDVSKPILENLTINLTSQCNLRCIHCYLDSYKNSESLRIPEFKNFVLESLNNKFLSKKANFAILGGEPLLAKEKVIKIAEIGKNLGLEVIVSTNGLLIDPAFAKEAKKSDLVVQVSLDGSCEEINSILRGKGNFEKSINGIRYLIKEGVYTIISMVVHEDNYHDIEDFFYLGLSFGANEVRYIPLKIMGKAKFNLKPIEKKSLLLAIDKLIRKEKRAKDYLKRDYYSIMKATCAYSNKVLYCGTGLKTILIDSDGSVYPCPNHCLPEFKIGNIYAQSFNYIWLNNPILNKIRTTYDISKLNNKCSNCTVKFWCSGGCRGEAYENTRNLRSPAVGCEDIRKSIIETFWILSREHKIYPSERREYF
ncbi:MAG: hypothetical protein CEE42_12670 [Promethearchaeota archaeon Loki_b31]|nr:MAG: hypothetical protein CEE42_12670 [Candidatus Lokiarchaeota archaeon Loki_b31]